MIIDKQTRQRIAEKYASGMTARDVGIMFGCQSETVSRICKEAGIAIRGHNYIRTKKWAEDPVKRFWEYVDKRGPNECWHWTGTISTRGGYGQLWIPPNKSMKAHRMSYTISVGDIPDGLFVCHSCDNPICVNPNHLWLGTAYDNWHDMLRKGRWRPSSKPEARPRGSQHYHSKLTESDVVEIRALASAGELSNKAIGKRFSVSGVLVGRIIRRLQWAHVP